MLWRETEAENNSVNKWNLSSTFHVARRERSALLPLSPPTIKCSSVHLLPQSRIPNCLIPLLQHVFTGMIFSIAIQRSTSKLFSYGIIYYQHISLTLKLEITTHLNNCSNCIWDILGVLQQKQAVCFQMLAVKWPFHQLLFVFQKSPSPAHHMWMIYDRC